MRNSPFFIVGIMCLAEVLTMLGVFTFPSLMPEFIATWQLSNTEAGWIAGILLGGYAISVPVLVSLTDRIDARLVYLGGASLTAVSLFGFAYLASGFWSALILRVLAGFGLAATYMPGLRVLVDRYEGAKQARALAFYTASFSLGTAVSFYYSGEVGTSFGWSQAHVIAGVGAVAAAILVIMAMHPVTTQKPDVETRLLDFRPILRNREVMGYVLAYCAHSWELFAMRSWLVAFLAFSLTLQGSTNGVIAPTVVATLSAFFAMLTSICGNELTDRFGRRRMVVIYLMSAGVLALVLGFLAALPYWIVVMLVILYAGLIQLDSAALTAGAVMAAEKGRRGATLGLHALVGFSGGAIGPLVVGMVLDLSGGGESVASWGYAFASMGLVALLGPIALWKLRGSASA
ncbi:MAG: MFS transporter [Rhodospirillales bacterium]|jgi:MFS family permease|nr:MFS transporter [Rhodospirillales bacterium]